jgi:hypothetical protein
MARHFQLMLIAAISLAAAEAFACDKHGGAAHGHPTAVKSAAAPQSPVQTSSAELRLLEEVDKVFAEKCSCTNAADCTCKKGSCKCSKCGNRHRSPSRMIAPLKGRSATLKIPSGARRDATAGIFL